MSLENLLVWNKPFLNGFPFADTLKNFQKDENILKLVYNTSRSERLVHPFRTHKLLKFLGLLDPDPDPPINK
jgi:hypothetical protein